MICGDILHSRVALSNIYGLKTMGAKITLCGPPNLIPEFLRDLGVNINYDVDEVIDFETIINEVALLRNRWLGIMKGLDTKQWQMGHVVRLRTAGMEDIRID